MTRPEEIARALKGRRSGRGWVARCPAHADRNPSLSIGSASDGRLLLHCFAGCAFEDILDALQAQGVIVEARRTGGAPSQRGDARRRSRADEAHDDVDRVAFARRLWGSALPVKGTLVETYLSRRGVDLPPLGLRFAPQLRHPSGAVAPAMVAAIRDRGGALIGVHRTWLTLDGRGKATLDPPKAMLGRAMGDGVHLRNGEGALAVAEGIETALSLGEAIPEASIVAALSASGVASYRLPHSVDALIIGADGDAAGRRAARELATRASRSGWRVRIMSAPDGFDWNDVLVGRDAGDRSGEARHAGP